MFAIDQNDDLYGWGRNMVGELGLGVTRQSDDIKNTLEKIGTKKYKAVQVARLRTTAIDTGGTLYTWGGAVVLKTLGLTAAETKTSPPNAPLAFQRLVKWTDSPKKMSDKKFKSISLGDFYSLALGEDGFLYHWGLGPTKKDNGQLITNSKPTQIDAARKYKFVAAGAYNFATLDEQGYLYASGSYVSATEKEINTLQKIESRKYKFISAQKSIVAIDEQGYLWIFGYSDS